MSWRQLARRDVLDPVRSYSILVLAGAHVLLFAVPVATATNGTRPVVAGDQTGLFLIFVPVVTLLATYDTIAGPRAAGELRVLLGLPHSRRDLVLGTLVGRVVVMAAMVGLSVLTIVDTVLILDGHRLSPVAMGVAWLLASAYAAAIAAVGVALSSASSTSGRAGVGGVVVLVTLASWGQLPGTLRWILNGFVSPGGPQPAWAATFAASSPVSAYQTAANAFVANGGPTAGQAAATQAAGLAGSPWYALVVLVGWVVVPTAVGVWVFDRVAL